MAIPSTDASREETIIHESPQLISVQSEDIESSSFDDPESQSNIAKQENATSIETEVATYKLCKKFMKTPCNHSYHIVCLKKWMEIRLECPTCRQVIPQPDDD